VHETIGPVPELDVPGGQLKQVVDPIKGVYVPFAQLGQLPFAPAPIGKPDAVPGSHELHIQSVCL